MRITTTDGKVIEQPDMCSCCRMSTAGEHEMSCPLYSPPIRVVGWLEDGYKTMAEENRRFAEQGIELVWEILPEWNTST